MRKIDVSIIIVNYNTLQLTKQCINSINEKTKGLSYEIILVDNASTDGSKEVFESDTTIEYIYNKNNIGFGKANNIGCQYAKGEYVFLLNSDTYLLNNAIYLLWKQFKDLKKEGVTNIACVGCMLRNSDGLMAHSYSKFPTMARAILDSSLYPILWKLRIISKQSTNSNYVKNGEGLRFFDVDYITGADLMIDRTVCDILGLFDPDFFMYSEEVELQHRYMKAGYRRIINNEAQIVHLEGKSNKSPSPQKKTIIIRSVFLYFKKTSGKLSFLVFSSFYKIVYIICNLLFFYFLNGKTRDKLKNIWEVIKI